MEELFEPECSDPILEESEEEPDGLERGDEDSLEYFKHFQRTSHLSIFSFSHFPDPSTFVPVDKLILDLCEFYVSSGLSQEMFYGLLDLCASPQFKNINSSRSSLTKEFSDVLTRTLNITPMKKFLQDSKNKNVCYARTR
jgi:hypothetical protein